MRTPTLRALIAAGALALTGLPVISRAQPAAETDLAVEVDAPATAPVGSLAEYEIAVTNEGPDGEPEAALTHELPDGMVLDAAETEAGSCVEGPSVDCELGPIQPGERVRVTLAAWPVESGTLRGTAVASGVVAGEGEAEEVVIEATGESCTVEGGPDNDVLDGGGGRDVLCGLGGDDVLRGHGGNDDLFGHEGRDILDGGAGADLLDGGPGKDTADWSAAPRGVRADLLDGTATGDGPDTLEGVEDVTGTRFDDLVLGSGVANLLLARGGHDVVFGRGGADTVRGGGGGDYLHGGAGADVLAGGPGPDACVPGPGGATRSGCEGPNPRDANDTRGPLDVGRVRGPGRSPPPSWTIVTRSRWTPRGMWDRGYLGVWIDALGGPKPDHLALIRSTGGNLIGRLFRVDTSGRERQIGRVRAWKRGERGAAVRVALHKLSVGSRRFSYRWSVQTLFTGRRCVRVCFDRVPGAGAMFSQPLPR